MINVASRPEEAAKVLVKAQVRFFRDARGIGIDSLQKTFDLLPELLTACGRKFLRLDLVLQLCLHAYLSHKN
jgi:hypothetical protein